MKAVCAVLLAVLSCAAVSAWAQEQRPGSGEAERQRYERAAAAGSADAMYHLGALFADGRGVTQDYVTARSWYERAAALGNADAMLELGVLYAKAKGVKQDYVTARGWFEKAAAVGNTTAMTDLGILYVVGLGVAQNYNAARGWFEKAAAAGKPDAMTDLGILYLNGQGVTQDYSIARSWFEKAAAAGNALAMRVLGSMSASGQGVPRDNAAARGWYEKAAAGGNVDAMLALGVLYAKGEGVTQDYAVARGWFEKAAAEGNTTAMTDLGLLYANGQGVTQDKVKARAWYEKATVSGHVAALAHRGTGASCVVSIGAAAGTSARNPNCSLEERIQYQSTLIVSVTIGSGRITCSGEIMTASGIVATANHCLKPGWAVQVLVGGNDNRPAEVVSQDAASDIALLKIPADPGEFVKLPSAHVANWDDSYDKYFSYAYPMGVTTPRRLSGNFFAWTEVGMYLSSSGDLVPGIDYNKAVIKVYPASQKGVSGALFVDETTQLPLGMAILSSKSKDTTLLVPWSRVEDDVNALRP